MPKKTREVKVKILCDHVENLSLLRMTKIKSDDGKKFIMECIQCRSFVE